MSAALLAAGKLVFAAMGIAVGVKLASTARARGAWGLHSVAFGAICVGGLGLLLMPAATALSSYPLMIAAEAGVRGGMLLLCVFVAGTFRPTPVGWAGAAVASAALVASIVWDISAQAPVGETYDYALPSSHANQLSIAAPFLWATIESGLLWLRGRRRLELGLIDPAVVRSYGLWALATAAFVGICVLAMGAGVSRAAGMPALADLAHGTRGVLYLAVSALIWLGLFQRARAPEERAAAA